MVWFNICYFYFILLFLCHQASPVVITTPNTSNFYTAALFEHNRKGNWTTQMPFEIIDLNLDDFERAAEIAASKGADIIIFPEYGILPRLSREEMKSYLEEVPDPRKEVSNPCNQDTEFASRPMMYRLSCMAKRNNIVVVANTGDIQPCSTDENKNCPYDGTFHYNTNVAFDRDGTILAKYHKERLFFEEGMDLPHESQNPIFSTDFGTFAMFVSFDSIWKLTVETAQMKVVDNIILTAMWVDSMPLWNAVQWGQSWALGNNVTLLVSNGNIPGYFAVGSGVFTGHAGALKYTFNPDGLSKLIITEVPKSKQQNFPFSNVNSSIIIVTASGSEPYNELKDGEDVPEYCSYKILGNPININKDYRCIHENTANFTFVKLIKRKDRLQACNNGMCCSLEYFAKDMIESYYLGVYNGTHNLYDRYFFCEENCLVVRCDSVNNSICSRFPLKANTVFYKFELRSNFTTKFIYPSVVKSGIRLAPMSEWTYGINGKKVIRGYLTYESYSSQPLLVAGLTGRCYKRDPPYVR